MSGPRVNHSSQTKKNALPKMTYPPGNGIHQTKKPTAKNGLSVFYVWIESHMPRFPGDGWHGDLERHTGRSLRIRLKHVPVSHCQMPFQFPGNRPVQTMMQMMANMVATEAMLVQITSWVASCPSLSIWPAITALDTATGVANNAIRAG